MKIKALLFSSLAAVLLLLPGCGQDKELSTFQSEFDSFCTNVADIDASINAIDATREDAPAQLLTLLDSLQTEFETLADMKLPDEFSYMEGLADEAGENMALAVEQYHLAYEGETYDASAANIASQYYERAYKRVQYIITLLHGEIPEDVNVSADMEE